MNLCVLPISARSHQAIESYKAKREGNPPDELFVHGRVRFEEPERNGFWEAAGKRTKVVGVKIDDADAFRLYREQGSMPVMRGLHRAFGKMAGVPGQARSSHVSAYEFIESAIRRRSKQVRKFNEIPTRAGK